MEKRINLKVLRTRHNLTQEEMAKKCGIHRGGYSLIEAGTRSGTPRFWLNLKTAFDLTPDELFKIQYEIHLSKQE